MSAHEYAEMKAHRHRRHPLNKIRWGVHFLWRFRTLERFRVRVAASVVRPR